MKRLLLGLTLFFASVTSAFANEPVKVLLKTNKGDITLSLDKAKAPQTVENFLSYVKSGFYTDTVFHRVIKGFMIQGGGMTEDLSRKDTQPPIQNEADNGLSNDKYTIAMARTNAPHSATSQFFINTENNDFLNHKSKSGSGWGYCVFGKVVDGIDVVEAISDVQTQSKPPHGDVPKNPIIIQSASLIE